MLVDIDLTARIVMLIFNIMYISKLSGIFGVIYRKRIINTT